jgi:hypothetical protein
MSLDFTLYTTPSVPLEADVLSPARLAGLSALETAKLTVGLRERREARSA